MRKKKWTKKGNVFIFPGTAEGLVRKGRASLEEKDYEKAVLYLTEALEYPLVEEEEVKMALLLALYESARYEEALALCKEMLHKGLGEYYDVLDLYILILMEQKRYDVIVSTLSALIEEKQLPEEKRENLERLFQLSKKLMKAPENAEAKPLFTSGDSLREQTLKLVELTNANIHPYKKELFLMLENPQTHPFLQTLALNVLKEHGVDQLLDVRKFYFHKKVIPSMLEDVFDGSFYEEVIRLLEAKLAQENPVLMEQAREMVKRHFFLLYPFEPEDSFPESWAEATLRLVRAYYEGGGAEREAAQEVRRSLALIKELDEISSPIM
ncbi:tetratricopeptide repeat protein [Bacillus xiapuensis]|uniref:tetratricopeptide repeat protein n=1 Tax=Bacillus xiapuensis TaxID=2014075 RepID=UPI000C235081|nr:hypothetical protein [Bacillus xiapuensis]